MWQITEADVLEWAANYNGPRFHALLCDPPYAWAFMGKSWDNGVAMRPETWAALAEHLLPGAFIMAFGGARTYHRLACAMEDAGLRIFPALGWLNGQGFPKATRIKGDERFSGHRYGLQVLKPCLEFIAVAQKPYEGKPVDCITATGAGAIWIDGARIGADGGTRKSNPPKGGAVTCYGDGLSGGGCEAIGKGRWPANFAICHAPECERVGTRQVKGNGHFPKARTGAQAIYGNGKGLPQKTGRLESYLRNETVAAWDCPPHCPVRRLGEQSGERKSGGKNGAGNVSIWGGADTRRGGYIEPSTGTAARFFFQANWSYEIVERLAGLDMPVMYCPKASRKERDAGLKEIQEQTGHSTYGDYAGTPEHVTNTRGKLRNPHPTVKPIALCRWLATLLLPPKEYAPRRILVPFAGSGSEAIGARLAGWDEIVLVEMDADYCEIAEARLAHWLRKPEQPELLQC